MRSRVLIPDSIRVRAESRCFRLQVSTNSGCALVKLGIACGRESRPVKVVADRPGPSLEGVVAKPALKRRQESCGMRTIEPRKLGYRGGRAVFHHRRQYGLNT